jgi:squalene-associated FAD-dependent desaturase
MNPGLDLQQNGVVILGAGFAGLSAAVQLVLSGHRVTLVEATSQGGGRARSFHDDRLQTNIDNGQHLMMGSYRETLRFLKSLGTDGLLLRQTRMKATMLRPDGASPIAMKCPRLPAPLHLAAGLVGMRGIGILDRLGALRAGLVLAQETSRPDDNETCDAWLERVGQTQAMRRAFWDPLIWGALNEDPLIASAAMLLAVLDRAFLGTAQDSTFIVPRVGLSELYVEPALKLIREHGAQVIMGDPCREIQCDSDRGHCITLKSGKILRSRALISALPPHGLLPLLPPALAQDLIFRDVAKLEYSPIVNLWVKIDRPLWSDQPFVGLIDSPLHWIFDRTQIEAKDRGESTLLSFTISGARVAMRDDPAQLQRLLEDEVRRFFGKRPRILGFRAIKERRATISHAAKTYQRRPECETPVRGFFLAGDWVRTGLPATIESAVQSGHVAARLASNMVAKTPLLKR